MTENGETHVTINATELLKTILTNGRATYHSSEANVHIHVDEDPSEFADAIVNDMEIAERIDRLATST